MSIETDLTPRTPAQRLARVVTEAFAPAIWAATTPVVIATHITPTFAEGLRWGLLAIVFAALIPYGIVWYGVRRGRLTDHHIGLREQRRTPLLLALASVLTGLVLLALLHAPPKLITTGIVMPVVLLGIVLVNQFWKLSAHTAVSAGAVAVLALVFGPVLLLGVPVVALIGWSRVVLADHTLAQVIAGAVTGGALAWTTMTALS
jgi:membrane-associated phospholipid phosphatase